MLGKKRLKPKTLLDNAIYPALALLPEQMNSLQAIALMIAIGLQESELRYRLQAGGPARGYWQFERGGGVQGVLTHPATAFHIQSVLVGLDYPTNATSNNCYNAIAHNDILAASFARLLIWSNPDALPDEGEAQRAWNYYIECWRPGKPHVETWGKNFRDAWELVGKEEIKP